MDDAIIKTEAKCLVNITNFRKEIFLIWHYNSANSFFNANGVKILQQFKTKDSEIKPYPLWLGNKDFTFNKMIKTGLNRFSVSYEAIDASYIENIHKCLCINAWIYQGNVYCSGVGVVIFWLIIA